MAAFGRYQMGKGLVGYLRARQSISVSLRRTDQEYTKDSMSSMWSMKHLSLTFSGGLSI